MNHFPQAGFLCNKDQLYRMLKKYRALYGHVYNFTPLTFILPNDFSKIIDIMSSRKANTSVGSHNQNYSTGNADNFIVTNYHNNYHAVKDDLKTQGAIYFRKTIEREEYRSTQRAGEWASGGMGKTTVSTNFNLS